MPEHDSGRKTLNDRLQVLRMKCVQEIEGKAAKHFLLIET
jgi:hypothetical protein